LKEYVGQAFQPVKSLSPPAEDRLESRSHSPAHFFNGLIGNRHLRGIPNPHLPYPLDCIRCTRLLKYDPMLSKLNNIILWQYSDSTPTAKLLRHHRLVRSVAYLWAVLCVLMVSSFAEVIIFNGSSTITLVILGVSSILGILLAVPATAAYYWAREIERTLRQRGTPVPRRRSVEHRIGIAAMKMVFWVVVLVVAFHFLPRPPSGPYSVP
jgi:hypothetical protein